MTKKVRELDETVLIIGGHATQLNEEEPRFPLTKVYPKGQHVTPPKILEITFS